MSGLITFFSTYIGRWIWKHLPDRLKKAIRKAYWKGAQL